MRSEVSKRILSETSDERKQKVRESTNELLKTMKEAKETMKAKEEAKELVDQFYKLVNDGNNGRFYNGQLTLENQKKCALKVVQKIYNLQNLYYGAYKDEFQDKQMYYSYWEDVIDEIKKYKSY